MTDEEKQQPVQFPAFPQGLQVAHPKQAGPLNKMLFKGLSTKLARHPRSGIRTNQTVHFGRRSKQTTKWKKSFPYY